MVSSEPEGTPQRGVEVKLMGGSDPARQNEMPDLARSIYK
jgi:hypothetical protein